MRRGFTILELTVVIALTGILAVSVIPAIGVVEDARRGAAGDEVARLLRLARATAAAAGEPVGLRVDADRQELRLVVAAANGSTPLLGAAGEPAAPLSMARAFPGVRVEGLAIDGDAGEIVWFAPDAKPVLMESGMATGPQTGEAEIAIADGPRIVVHPLTGHVEVLRP